MRGIVDNGVPVPAFLVKLWKMVDDEETNNLISWSSDGESFIIKNQSEFCAYLIPLFYKHSNMASFIRQLNMYGFRKVSSIENGSLRGDREEIEFCHEFFKQNNPQLLELIKRKTPPKSSHVDANNFELINKILDDLDSMKNRQGSVNTQLSLMKQQNVALWREVVTLRQKHEKQTQIVNKLIQFILTLVQPSGRTNLNGIPVKRKYPLMIYGDMTNDSHNKKRKISENENTNGPTIHELDTADALFDQFDVVESDSEPTVELAGSRAGSEKSPSSVLDDMFYDENHVSQSIKFEPVDDDDNLMYDMKPNVSEYITINGNLTPVISINNVKNKSKNKNIKNDSGSSTTQSRVNVKNDAGSVAKLKNNMIKINIDDGIKILDNINAQVSVNGVKALNGLNIVNGNLDTSKSKNLNVAVVKSEKNTAANTSGQTKKPATVVINPANLVRTQTANNQQKYADLLKQYQQKRAEMQNKSALIGNVSVAKQSSKGQKIQNKSTVNNQQAKVVKSANGFSNASVVNTNDKTKVNTKPNQGGNSAYVNSENNSVNQEKSSTESSVNNSNNVEDVLQQLLDETILNNEASTSSDNFAVNNKNTLISGISTERNNSDFLNELVNDVNTPSNNSLISGGKIWSPSRSPDLNHLNQFQSSINPDMSLTKFNSDNLSSSSNVPNLREIDSQIGSMQSELEQLTDMLNSEGYSVDANNFLSLFDNDSSLLTDNGLPNNGLSSSNNELMAYNPTLDFSSILDNEDADDRNELVA